MPSFEEQMKRLHDEDDEYNNVWPHSDWTIEDYRKLFYHIDKGYLVQGEYYETENAFIINESWEGDPLWEEE